MPFDYDSAKASGYNDEEIASFLAKKSGYDIDSAVKSGYSHQEVAHFLSQESPEEGGPLPQDSASSEAPEDIGLLEEGGPLQQGVDFLSHSAEGLGLLAHSTRRLRDFNVSAAHGMVDLVESGVGLADIATSPGGTTGGVITKGLYEAGLAEKPEFEKSKDKIFNLINKGLGLAHSGIDTLYSPEKKEIQKKVDEAEGAWDTTKTMVSHPSSIAHFIVRSLPATLVGPGGIGRGLLKSKLGKELVKRFGKKIAPIITSATGEGMIQAGGMASDVRGEKGELSITDAVMSLGSGAGTTAFAFAGGRFAKKLGFDDVDTMLAAGKSSAGNARGVVSKIVGGGFTEGAFEELSQSMQETIWANAAFDRPLLEGVGKAGAQGALTGFGMGAGFNAAASISVAKEKGEENAKKAAKMSGVEESGIAPTGETARLLVDDILSGAYDVEESFNALQKELDEEPELQEEVKRQFQERLQESTRKFIAAGVQSGELSPDDAGVIIDAGYKDGSLNDGDLARLKNDHPALRPAINNIYAQSATEKIFGPEEAVAPEETTAKQEKPAEEEPVEEKPAEEKKEPSRLSDRAKSIVRQAKTEYKKMRAVEYNKPKEKRNMDKLSKLREDIRAATEGEKMARWEAVERLLPHAKKGKIEKDKVWEIRKLERERTKQSPQGIAKDSIGKLPNENLTTIYQKAVNGLEENPEDTDQQAWVNALRSEIEGRKAKIATGELTGSESDFKGLPGLSPSKAPESQTGVDTQSEFYQPKTAEQKQEMIDAEMPSDDFLEKKLAEIEGTIPEDDSFFHPPETPESSIPVIKENTIPPQEDLLQPKPWHTGKTAELTKKYGDRREKNRQLTNAAGIIEDKVQGAKDPNYLAAKFFDRMLRGYGVVDEDVLNDAMNEMEKAGQTYTLERGDGQNLKGANTFAGSHDKADQIAKQVWGEVYARETQKYGALVGKKGGGDEFVVLWPGYTEAEVREIRADIDEQIESRKTELGLTEISHPGAGGMPIGAYGVDSGFIQWSKENPIKRGEMHRKADVKSEALSHKKKVDFAKKNGYDIIENEKGEISYVKRAKASEVGGAAGDQVAERPDGVPGEAGGRERLEEVGPEAPPTGEENQRNRSAVTPPESTTPPAAPAAPGLTDTQKTFIEGKIKELGSVEAVDEKYSGNDKISQHARDRAREVFATGKPAKAPEAPAAPSIQPGDILTNTNKPFKTKGAAFTALKSKKLQNTHEAVEVGEKQWVVREKAGKTTPLQESTETALEGSLNTERIGGTNTIQYVARYYPVGKDRRQSGEGTERVFADKENAESFLVNAGLRDYEEFTNVRGSKGLADFGDAGRLKIEQDDSGLIRVFRPQSTVPSTFSSVQAMDKELDSLYFNWPDVRDEKLKKLDASKYRLESMSWGELTELATEKGLYKVGMTRKAVEESLRNASEATETEAQPEAGKEPWGVTFGEAHTQDITPRFPNDYAHYTTIDGKSHRPKTEKALDNLVGKNKKLHKQAVQQALSEGKSVPEEVLKEYPDLQKAPAAPKPETEAGQDDIEVETEGGETTVSVDMPEAEAQKLSLKEQKAFLLEEIDKAIEVAGSGREPQMVTFEVPGDGTFNIYKDKESLQEFKKGVKKHWPKVSEGKFKPQKDETIDYPGRKKKYKELVGDPEKLTPAKLADALRSVDAGWFGKKRIEGGRESFFTWLLQQGIQPEVRQAIEREVAGDAQEEAVAPEGPSAEPEAMPSEIQEKETDDSGIKKMAGRTQEAWRRMQKARVAADKGSQLLKVLAAKRGDQVLGGRSKKQVLVEDLGYNEVQAESLVKEKNPHRLVSASRNDFKAAKDFYDGKLESLQQARNEAAEESSQDILIRKPSPRERKGGTVRSRALAEIPAKEGYEAVYKPYGNTGDTKDAGFYYTPAKSQKGTAPIDDFGEVLEGARKYYAEKLENASQYDIASNPLSKTWPEPNYQKMIDDGMDPKLVAMVRAMRDTVPAKGRSRYKVSRYVEAVGSMRDFAQRLLNGEVSYEKFIEGMDESQGLQSVLGAHDLYLAVGHEHSLKGIRISRGEYSMLDGKKIDPPKIIWTIERQAQKTAWSNWPKMLAQGDSRQEAIDNFKKKADTVLQNENPKIHFVIYSKRGEPGVYIGKKMSSRNYVDLEKFDDVKAARAYLAENQKALEEKLKKAKDFPRERKDENAPRVGEDHLQGQDATPEMFTEAFGFRGVQFGNYVEQANRQEDLSETYNALMDMAGVLGIPARAISLNGELGLAFGARGKGGKLAPSAHYEPGTVVINLTKKRGAGSLAHEWWHSLDNYFDRMRGGSDYVTQKPWQRGTGEIRQPVLTAFQNIMKEIKESSLPNRSMVQDRTRSKDYWSTDVEMSARAFESYIREKLYDQNGSNDYLANIVDEEAWEAAAAMGFEQEGSYPYPTKKEMPQIKRTFQDFFDVVEFQETDKGVALYQITPRSPRDHKYLELAKDPEANREELQKMVDEAAKRAGYVNMDGSPEVWYHGGLKGLSQIDEQSPDRGTLGALYLTNNKLVAKHYALTGGILYDGVLDLITDVKVLGKERLKAARMSDEEASDRGINQEDFMSPVRVYALFVKAEKIIDPSKITPEDVFDVININEITDAINDNTIVAKKEFNDASELNKFDLTDIMNGYEDYSSLEIEGFGADAQMLTEASGAFKFIGEIGLTEIFIGRMKGKGYDAIKIHDDWDTMQASDTLIVLSPYQIKSADPVTYDDAGNAIPLSKRFNKKSDDIRFQKETPSTGITRNQVESALQAPIAGLRKQVGINIVQAESELPDTIKKDIAQKNAQGQISGVWTGGQVYFIADNLKSKEHAQAAFLHEIFGHYGVEALLPTGDYNRFLTNVHLSKGKGSKYRKIIKDYNLDQWRIEATKKNTEDISEMFQNETAAKERADNLRAQDYAVDLSEPKINTREGRFTAAREYIARQAESGVDDRAITKLIGMVRDALRKLGLHLKINDNDIRRLIAMGARQVTKRKGPEYLTPDTTAFSRMAAMWYSEMEQTLADKLPNKGTGKSYASTVQAWAGKGQIKQEELEWSGLIDWLNDQGKVSKEEVLDWLAANNVRVEEVVKDDSANRGGLSTEEYRRELERMTGGELQNEIKSVLREDVDRDALNDPTESFDYIEKLVSEYEWNNESAISGAFADIATKFSEYQIPGGENYKELLITLPGGEYKSSHFDEKGIFAHVRINERTGPNGERVLFVEEVQSDWHQAGRKKGYEEKLTTLPDGWSVIENKENYDEIIKTKSNSGKPIYAAMKNGYRVAIGVSERDVLNKLTPNWSVKTPSGETFLSEGTRDKAVQAAIDKLNSKHPSIPDAPFKKSWPLLAMKRIVRYAAENGFDTVAWTPGEVQADRYDLSKQVNTIGYKKVGDNQYDLRVTAGPNNQVYHDEKGISLNKIEELAGKDISQRVKDNIGYDDGQWMILEGENLKVGGEGMAGFYDKILPAAVNKFFGKAKWGKAKVGRVEINDGGYVQQMKEPEGWQVVGPKNQFLGHFNTKEDAEAALNRVAAHALPITPEMRDKALSEGMPLFQFAGRKALGATQLDQAQAMKDQGASRKKVWKDTGWWEIVPGQWSFEIDDSKAYLKKPFPEKGQLWGHTLESAMEKAYSEGRLNLTVEDILSHPTLFEQYPEMADISVGVKAGDGASYVRPTGREPARIEVGQNVIMSDFKSVLSHEVQHAIQEEEGFARGGNTETAGPGKGVAPKEIKELYNKLVDEIRPVQDEYIKLKREISTEELMETYTYQKYDAMQRELNALSDRIQNESRMSAYRTLTGEVEARLTQRRMDMTSEQRKAEPPWETMEKMLREEGLLEEGQSPEDVLATRHDGDVAAMETGDKKSLFESYGAEIKGNKVVLYRGGDVSKTQLKKLRYGDHLSATRSGNDVTGNEGAAGYGKNVIRLELPLGDVEVTGAGEFQYKGEAESILGGTKYPQEIYRAYNDYYGSNYTAAEIDQQDNVRSIASMALEGGRDQFDDMVAAMETGKGKGDITTEGYPEGPGEVEGLPQAEALPDSTRPAGEPGTETNPDIMYQRVVDEAATSTPSILNALKKRKGDFALAKPDITLADRVLNLMSHYSLKVPALRKVYEAGLSWVDDKFHYGNQIFKIESKDGKEISYINVVNTLKSNNKIGYARLQKYLLKRDQNGIGYRVKQADDEGFALLSPKGAKVSAHENEDAAWREAVNREKKDMIAAGYTRDVANALVAFRMMAHNIFRMRHRTIEELISKYESEGRKPEIAYRDEAGKEIKIDLKAALAEMGDLRGHYFPRIRQQGQWVIRAKKSGENPILEMRDTKLFANKRRAELGRQGYKVEPITRSEKTPESVFALAGQNIAVNELVNKALETVDSPKAKTLKELGIIAEWDGDDLLISGAAPRGKDKEVLEAYGGVFETKKWQKARSRGVSSYYRFKNADAALEDKLKEMLFFTRGTESADTELLFAYEFAQQLGNTIKERGARSALIQRRRLVGKDVWLGYEQDPLQAITRAGQSTASAQAKKEMAVKMIQAIQGTGESWKQYKARMEEAGETVTYDDYWDMVKEQKISASKQKNTFESATKYMQDMLRNDEAIDRVMGTVKGIAVLKYLGFRIAAPAVNLTALVTNVPATMAGYAGIPIKQAPRLLGGAMNDYRKWHKDPKAVTPDVSRALDHIHENGWHSAQFNMEAINALKGKTGRAWGKFMDASMAMFGATEQLNRVSSILGAYKGIRKVKPNLSFEEAIKLAKEVSDKAHGTYGKVNYPELARGTNVGAQILKSAYVFKTFSHNYLATLKELGLDKRDYKAATYMMVAPAILSGATASVAVPGTMAAINALLGLADADADDPEEELYRWVYEHAGPQAQRFVEQGMFGLLGINLKGSLQISVTDIPTTPVDILGAPGSMFQDLLYGLSDIWHGQYDKGLESIIPNAFAAPMKAYRERFEGITTHSNTPVFWGRERLRSSSLDAWLRALSFNPAELSSKRGELWRERKIQNKYRDRRAEINSRIKDFWLQPPAKRDKATWADIVADIYEYNKRIVRTGKVGVFNPITGKNIQTLIKRSFKPDRKEIIRARRRYQ